MDFNAVGKQFVEFYYTVYDSDRSKLANLFADSSMLSFEGEQFMGPTAIMGKLTSLGFQTVKHEIVTLDSHPVPQSSGVLCFVVGRLVVDGGMDRPLMFSECFHLAPLPGGQGFYVQNCVFRLSLH